MAINVKDIGSSAAKWGNRASGAAGEYAENAAAAAPRWAANTQNSGDNFQAGISAGDIKQRFTRGVARAAAKGKYANKIAAVGSGRYSSGVSGATGEWSSGFEPYHRALSGMSLPARRPRGDAANYERVRAVGQQLHATRLAQLGTK